jgi:hypothetical protein
VASQVRTFAIGGSEDGSVHSWILERKAYKKIKEKGSVRKHERHLENG